MLDAAESDEPAEPDDEEPGDDEELGADDEPAEPLGSAAIANPLRPDNANTATKDILRFITASLGCTQSAWLQMQCQDAGRDLAGVCKP